MTQLAQDPGASTPVVTGAIPVIIVAHNASQAMGGQALLPLQYFRRLRARNVECWLITHARVRRELESILGDDAKRVFFVEDTTVHRLLFAGSKFLPRRVSENTFGVIGTFVTLRSFLPIIRNLINVHGARVVHQPSPISPRLPSPIAGLGIPVVIGPMNGGMNFPPAFAGRETFATRLFIDVSRMLSGAIHHLIRGKRDAAVLLAANQRTRAVLPECPKGKVIMLTENGVDLSLWKMRSPEQVVPGQFISVSRFVDWKRVDILLQALARVPSARLELVGDGKERPALEALASTLGITGRVVFRGYQTQDLYSGTVCSSTAMVLASIYEAGGAVVLEAMAVGTPSIVSAWGGLLDYADPTTTVLVSVDSEETMIREMAAAMQLFIDQPERAAAMGLAGRARIEREFDWERKIDRIQEIYREAVAIHAPPQ